MGHVSEIGVAIGIGIGGLYFHLKMPMGLQTYISAEVYSLDIRVRKILEKGFFGTTFNAFTNNQVALNTSTYITGKLKSHHTTVNHQPPRDRGK
ncbi:hypothetical protein Trydic_g2957 [Trypoxylus dichotomus]